MFLKKEPNHLAQLCYSSSSGIALDMAIASAPVPIWQETDKESGQQSICLLGNTS